jgi:CRISPR type III-A-associated RAMP protein Csm5
MDITPSINRYKIELEILSPACVSGSEEISYQSHEYFIHEGRLYFVSTEDIFNLYEKGIIKEDDLDLEYKELIDKIMKNAYAKKYLRSARLDMEIANKLELKKFGYIKKINMDEGSHEERPVIFGTTVKGMLRSGYLAYWIHDCHYSYSRTDSHKLKNQLKLDSVKINHKEIKEDIFADIFDKNQYTVMINTNNNDKLKENWIGLEEYNKSHSNQINDAEVIKLIFKNIVCHDLVLKDGEMAIEKIIKFHRKNNKEKKSNHDIPLYFETPTIGSKFTGEIWYKYDTYNYDKQLSIISIENSCDENTPVEECFAGLKKLSQNIINAEYEMLSKTSLGNRMKDFFEQLKKENEKEDQFVCKTGYAGILSKTLMAFDKTKIKNHDNYLPYTINIAQKDMIPTGWVKIRYERI